MNYTDLLSCRDKVAVVTGPAAHFDFMLAEILRINRP